jgi:GTP cyclohydrolase I
MLEQITSTLDLARGVGTTAQVSGEGTHAIPASELRKFEGYVAEIFTALGMDLEKPGTKDTPRRFVTALAEATVGYEGDHKLVTVFPTECPDGLTCRNSQIVEGPIDFYSLCEHHALPFYGRAYIGYIANDSIIGISKLTRLLRVFARRFTVQERIGQQVADTLERLIQPRGVAVYLEAHHMCTQMRGVNAPSPMTRTTFWRGEYEDNAALRSEFLAAGGVSR